MILSVFIFKMIIGKVMKKICCLFVILFVITLMGIAGAAEKIIIKTPDKIIQATEDNAKFDRWWNKDSH